MYQHELDPKQKEKKWMPNRRALTGSRAADLELSPRPGISASGQFLLSLQGRYGNRHVQQVVDASRQGTLAQPIQAKRLPWQKKDEPHPNRTGLPDELKAGVENLSGLSLDDVRVHYNSSKPAELQALAYTQGTNILVAPGQERHLPHEAWHIAQQKQNRVKPTLQIQGASINDDPVLEREADTMGVKALQVERPDIVSIINRYPVQGSIIQRQILREYGFNKIYDLAKKRVRGDETGGFTPPSVNGVIYGPSSVDDTWVFDALNKPTIEVKQVATTGEYIAQVTFVPVNHAGYLMYLPMPGPWRAEARKEYIYGYYGLKIEPSEAEDTVTLIVTGKPDAPTLERQIKAHEEVHARDIMKAIQDILVPWDERLTNALSNRTDYRGITERETRENLWKAMGGTPQQIGKELNEKWTSDSEAFHKTEEGGSPPPEVKVPDKDHVELEVSLPIG